MSEESNEPTDGEAINNKWYDDSLVPAVERLANLSSEDWSALMTVYNYFGSKMGEGVIKGARIVARRQGTE